MTEVIETKPVEQQFSTKGMVRLVGTIIVILLLMVAQSIIESQQEWRYTSDVEVAEEAYQAELATQTESLLASYRDKTIVVEDGTETYYLSKEFLTWSRLRPEYLDENHEVILTVQEQSDLQERARAASANATVVGVLPAWLGLSGEPVTFEKYNSDFGMLSHLMWTGFLCSLPLYAALFKRKKAKFGWVILTIVGLFIFGFVPAMVAFSTSLAYQVAYCTPLISMLLLWRLTRTKPTPEPLGEV